jgi:hypothetical protein
MKATAARLGDAMLSRVLRRADAGACITGTGSPCKCAAPCGATWCTQYRISCFGQCLSAGTRC